MRYVSCGCDSENAAGHFGQVTRPAVQPLAERTGGRSGQIAHRISEMAVFNGTATHASFGVHSFSFPVWLCLARFNPQSRFDRQPVGERVIAQGARVGGTAC